MIYDIPEHIANRLMAHPDLDGRVYVERDRQLSESELPCVDVRFVDAEADSSASWQTEWTGRFTVTVKVCAIEPHAPALKAARLSRIVRDLLCSDTSLGGLLTRPLRIDAMHAEKDSEGEVIVRAVVIDISAYWVEPSLVDPGELSDLVTVHVEIDMASPRNDPPLPTRPDGQIDAQVTIHML